MLWKWHSLYNYVLYSTTFNSCLFVWLWIILELNFALLWTRIKISGFSSIKHLSVHLIQNNKPNTALLKTFNRSSLFSSNPKERFLTLLKSINYKKKFPKRFLVMMLFKLWKFGYLFLVQKDSKRLSVIKTLYSIPQGEILLLIKFLPVRWWRSD